MYAPTIWIDDVYDPQTGELIQEGTPCDAERLKKIEQGIQAAHGVMEAGEVSMTTLSEYPFNDSAERIELTVARPLLNYQVSFEVLEADGPVGDVVVTYRETAAFGVHYTGSARTVRLRYFVTGGF